jgi:hypothetical protein
MVANHHRYGNILVGHCPLLFAGSVTARLRPEPTRCAAFGGILPTTEWQQ